MIAHLAKDVGIEEVKPFESILVGAGDTLEPRQMRTLTQATRLRLDPDGVLAADNRAHGRRWLDCDETYGGVFVLRGEFDAEGGADLSPISRVTGSAFRPTLRTHRNANAWVRSSLGFHIKGRPCLSSRQRRSRRSLVSRRFGGSCG
jgi:hypothetical protein